MDKYGWIIIAAIITGTIARFSMMRIDYRQYPSYPQGYISHITLGLIAAALGSVAIPALLEKEYAAVTFLALAAQQFRDVRSMERQSLDNIEPTELVPRGTAYIEDIAKAFEARNYMTMLVSLGTALVGFILKFGLNLSREISTLIGIAAGFIIMLLLKSIYVKKISVSEMGEVREAKITFEGPLLTINEVSIMNVGLKAAQEIYLKNGLAIEIIPKHRGASATLSNMGQRQAIQHNVFVQLGVRKDTDEPDFTPLIRRNPENGNLVMAVIPMEKNIEKLIDVVKSTPILESSKRMPIG